VLATAGSADMMPARCTVGGRGLTSGTRAPVVVGHNGPLLLLARPNENSKFFDLFKRISNGSDLIRLKVGLPEFYKFHLKYGFEAF
jgi:hypothetical protein